MKTLILWLIRKFLTPERIAQLLAGIIANLLRKASKTEKWDLFKGIIQKTEKACHLFNECYEDDNMDKDDEERIAQAIEKLDIQNILKNTDFMM